ncbi:GNAT family N-acetyltransferase [Aquimarina aquimarini]|uniref:GNAT family N-acetyltransferase n=1 Tax=Aquimarina aquimarini TaxID=1191734 RepID=UPI000D55BD0E|nr:GNAT family N-acetyltransferase [Aquimarina aquimarini]
MLEFKNLQHTSFSEIHSVFIDAFSDYQVPMQPTESELRYMFERRGGDLKLSYGAFDNNQLVGFILNGVGNWNGVYTSYDTGTGISKCFQKKGIAKDLFSYAIADLIRNGIKQYLLEVIKTNQNAISLYNKKSFMINRVFDYYIFSKSLLTNRKESSIKDVIIDKVTSLDWNKAQSFWDILPSWQNSIDAIQRKLDRFTILQVLIKDECVGYGIIERHTGDIAQLAIHHQYRRQGIAMMLLQELLYLSQSETVKIINIEKNYQPFRSFCDSLQLPKGDGQYEMMLQL